MKPNDKKEFLKFVSSVKFPDGYASNIARCVNVDGGKFIGLKSHDRHVFMQRLLPVGIRHLLPEDVVKPIMLLSRFFSQLTAKTLRKTDILQLCHDIVQVLCKFEMIFPPAFFTSMMHVMVHLPEEALLAGPVNYRWMYPIERLLGELKKSMSDLIRRRRAVTTTQSLEPPTQPTSTATAPASAATAPALMDHLAVGPAGSQAPASSASSVAQPVSARRRHRPASTTDTTSTDASGSQTECSSNNSLATLIIYAQNSLQHQCLHKPAKTHYVRKGALDAGLQHLGWVPHNSSLSILPKLLVDLPLHHGCHVQSVLAPLCCSFLSEHSLLYQVYPSGARLGMSTPGTTMS
ncbi:hypothetical protein L3X38_011102 [Prunus dulcis]|uniref:DUF4218 domain-containing protein n=1 Tax=Prunus dulcis TaxID=3755 RepID=A0AAD4WHG8_PRUDU|nr:hypothetical protein L3X38_011102 [Prunus dulcis]